MSPRFTSSPIALLLACVLAMGNVPAWWHCGGCRDLAEVSASVTCASPACCGCGSRPTVNKPATLSDTAGTSDSSHDSSDCLACRAALSASPAAGFVYATPLSVVVSYESVATGDSVYLPNAAIVHRLRGPPVASTL